MSKLDVQSDIINQGVKKLKLLAKHSELLLHSYYQQPVDELAVGELAIRQLLDADIFWRGGDEQASLKLSEPISQLLSHLLKDEKRRKANTDIGEFHENIRHAVGQIIHAQQQGQFHISNHWQSQLQQEVDDLNSRIANGIKSLWYRLNTGFAFVNNLNDKIHENEKAGQEVKRWLSGLEQIDFEELIRLAGHHAELRNILVRHLQVQVSAHLNNLLEVQKRLGELLASFRQQHEKNQLVRSLVVHFQRNPQFQPSNYAQRSEVASLFNQAKPLPPPVAISLDRFQDEDIVKQLISLLPARQANKTLTAPASAPIYLEENPLVIAERKALKEDVISFFISVYKNQQAHSALDYLQKSALKWADEIWLYQVIAEYQSLGLEERKCFHLHYHEAPASPSNHLWLVHDLELQAVK